MCCRAETHPCRISYRLCPRAPRSPSPRSPPSPFSISFIRSTPVASDMLLHKSDVIIPTPTSNGPLLGCRKIKGRSLNLRSLNFTGFFVFFFFQINKMERKRSKRVLGVSKRGIIMHYELQAGGELTKSKREWGGESRLNKYWLGGMSGSAG